MLQIISGKFYKSDQRHVSDGYGILYSNFTWIGPIRTCVGILEPVDSTSSLSSYVLRYKNQIERGGSTTFDLVRAGDGEIIEQFRLLASFGLNAYFNIEKDAVDDYCRTARRSHSDDFVPSQFVARALDRRVHGQLDEIKEFENLVERVIGLSRRNYKVVMSCVTNYIHALEAVSYNVDLAYSMMVYCLESLSKTFGREYTPQWEDYDAKSRKAVNRVLARISDEDSRQIRDGILANTQLRLRKRYTEFCSEHLGEGYFLNVPSTVSRPLRRSEMEAVLNHTYQARSGYVHELRPIQKHLRSSMIATDDVFVWQNAPYLTFRGLARLTRHVILSVIAAQEQVATEDYDWSADLPGRLQMEWAPEYWVAHPQGFAPSQAKKRLSGFLSSLQDMLVTNAPVPDMRLLLASFERILPQSPKEHVPAMVALYILYNAHVRPEFEVPGWRETLKKFEAALDSCSIESMIAHLLVSPEWPWDALTSEVTYEAYSRQKFKPNAVSIPLLMEVALMCKLANVFLEAGESASFHRWLEAARLEVPGSATIQAMIEHHRKERTPLLPQAIWLVANGLQNDESAIKQQSPQQPPPADGAALPLPPSEESCGVEPSSLVELSDPGAQRSRSSVVLLAVGAVIGLAVVGCLFGRGPARPALPAERTDQQER